MTGRKETEMRDKIYLEMTKKGYPAIWEEGGGYTNTGSATIVASPNGERLMPAYINQRGSLSCGQHALFIVHVDDIIVEADHHRRDFEINVYRITAIREEDGRFVADLDLINQYSSGEWESDLQPELEDSVHAAIEKATTYHCRRPIYIAADNYWGYET